MGEFGNVIPLDKNSEYTYQLGINDHLKFRQSRKTYPELIFECAGIPYTEPQPYVFPDFSSEIDAAGARLKKACAEGQRLKVGMNTGAGQVFATKKWPEEGYVGLADRLTESLGVMVLLLGGPAETERNARIAAAVRNPVVNTGNDNSIRDFAGIIGNCDLLVTGDTLAMHIAIGLNVPVVVILGATCHQEIELYGRGAKVISGFECSPCYLSLCPKEVTCMDATTVEQVLDAVRQVLKNVAEARG